jgi:hypothetical protein
MFISSRLIVAPATQPIVNIIFHKGLKQRKSPEGLFLVSSASIAVLGLTLIFYQNRGFFLKALPRRPLMF